MALDVIYENSLLLLFFYGGVWYTYCDLMQTTCENFVSDFKLTYDRKQEHIIWNTNNTVVWQTCNG